MSAGTTGESLTTLQYLQSQKFNKAIRKLYMAKVPIYSYFKTKTPKEFGTGRGDVVYFPVIYGLNNAFGMGSTTMSLPTPQSTDTIEGYTTMKYGYGRCRVNHRLIMQSQSNPMWFAEQMSMTMKSLTTSIAQDLGTQYVNDGSGILCRTNGAGTATTSLVVDSPSNKYLFTNMRVMSTKSWGSTATFTATQDISGAYITSATDANAFYISARTGANTATLSTADTWKDNKYVYRYGQYGISKCITGLGAIVDDYTLASASTSSFRGDSKGNQTVYGLSRTTYKDWNANVMHNSGTSRDLTLDLIDEAAGKTSEMHNLGGSPKLIHTSIALQRKYLALMRDDKRYVNTGKLDGGWSTLSYTNANGEIPMVADPFAYPGQMYFLDTDTFFILDGGGGWIDEHGSMLFQVANKPQYDLVRYEYQELGNTNPKANTVIRDLNET